MRRKNKNDLRLVLKNQEDKTFRDIDSLDTNRLLNSPMNDLIRYFKDKFYIELLQLHEDQIFVDQRESQIDVSNDPNRMIWDRSRPFLVTGIKINFFIPYKGDVALFDCQPSTFLINPLEQTLPTLMLSFLFRQQIMTVTKLRGNLTED